MTQRVRIALADDHAMFRQGLRLLLDLHDELEVVGEIDRADEISNLIGSSACDILLLDLQMERSSLIDIAAAARRTKVLIVTASEVADHAVEALRSGARGVVLKRFAAETLMDAIRAVAAGQTWVPPELAPRLAGELCNESPSLTTREREVVRYVALGLRNAEVGRKLFISEQTVKTHLNNIFEKLALRDRVELALYALRRGIISIGETETE